MHNSLDNNIRTKLATISGTQAEDWFLFSRLRHGLDLSLRILKEVEGSGEVITQAFTCITAVNPIVTSGLTPRFCDIAPETLSMDVDCFKKALNEQTKAAIIQHSFGATADVAGIHKVAQQHSRDLLLIEDSAHCAGTIARRNDLPFADLSFHSFGAEKLLATRFGGAVWINPDMKNRILHDRLVQAFSDLPRMSRRTRLRVALYPPLNGLLNRLPYQLSTTLRRGLSASTLFVSPIMPIEQTGRTFGRIENLSPRVMQTILSELKNYESIVEHRRKIATIYRDSLPSGYRVPEAILQHDLPYIRFPLICQTPEVAESRFHSVRAKGFAIGKWYRPLLFPGAQNEKQYGYNRKSSPVAEDVSAHIINLPTGPHITPQIAKDIIHEISR